MHCPLYYSFLLPNSLYLTKAQTSGDVWGSSLLQRHFRCPPLAEAWRGKSIPLLNQKRQGGCCAPSSLLLGLHSRSRTRRGGGGRNQLLHDWPLQQIRAKSCLPPIATPGPSRLTPPPMKTSIPPTLAIRCCRHHWVWTPIAAYATLYTLLYSNRSVQTPIYLSGYHHPPLSLSMTPPSLRVFG